VEALHPVVLMHTIVSTAVMLVAPVHCVSVKERPKVEVTSVRVLLGTVVTTHRTDTGTLLLFPAPPATFVQVAGLV